MPVRRLPSVLLVVVSVLAAVFFLSGCEAIPLPLPSFGKSHKVKIPWNAQVIPIRHGNTAEIRVRNRNDLPARLDLKPKLIDGYEFGTLEFRVGNERVFHREKCWLGRLVDVCQVKWSNGESWIFWVWDFGRERKFRTLSLFSPETFDLVSCELEFLPDLTTVRSRFTWDPGLKRLEKYHRFLEDIRGAYADAAAWGNETRGTRLFRQGKIASVTFQPHEARPFQDDLLFQREQVFREGR